MKYLYGIIHSFKSRFIFIIKKNVHRSFISYFISVTFVKFQGKIFIEKYKCVTYTDKHMTHGI